MGVRFVLLGRPVLLTDVLSHAHSGRRSGQPGVDVAQQSPLDVLGRP